MADWRQIQARIRRAKSGNDPLGQLTALFEKFKDAMVAYELGALEEAAGAREEALHWYGIAAERFRRSDWKKRAYAALERLGGNGTSPSIEQSPAGDEARGTIATGFRPVPSATKGSIAEEPVGANFGLFGAEVPAEAQPAPAKKKRRRGRRGGRKRRKKREAAAGGGKSAAVRVELAGAPPAPRPAAEASAAPVPMPEPGPSRFEVRYQARTGEPALASRMAKLESMLRQFMAGPPLPLTLETADQAPVGPGVLLISDADQTAHYYVEACDSLRAGIEQWLRGGRAGRHARRGKEYRARLAEVLGISEAKVTDYLKKHCAVRWLQLDEGAAHLAHFAIAVLQPTLSE